MSHWFLYTTWVWYESWSVELKVAECLVIIVASAGYVSLLSSVGNLNRADTAGAGVAGGAAEVRSGRLGLESGWLVLCVASVVITRDRFDVGTAVTVTVHGDSPCSAYLGIRAEAAKVAERGVASRGDWR